MAQSMIYVDALINWGWRLGPSCHLIADTLEELHEFAKSIGMRRAWFQDHGRLPHYDLTAARREKAVKLGAIELDRAGFVKKIKELRVKE